MNLDEISREMDRQVLKRPAFFICDQKTFEEYYAGLNEAFYHKETVEIPEKIELTFPFGKNIALYPIKEEQRFIKAVFLE